MAIFKEYGIDCRQKLCGNRQKQHRWKTNGSTATSTMRPFICHSRLKHEITDGRRNTLTDIKKIIESGR